MTDFVTSDTHFNHFNIIAYSKRPFQDVAEMNAAMIDRWNAVVQPEDTVYHLGDFAMGNLALVEIIRKKLNGRIVLIRGNHDQTSVFKHFDRVERNLTIDVLGHKVLMCHNPRRLVELAVGVDLGLCGHVHDAWTVRQVGDWLKGNPHKNQNPVRVAVPMINVGVDCWNFAPQVLERVVQQHFERQA